jgi:hypothetical protein
VDDIPDSLEPGVLEEMERVAGYGVPLRHMRDARRRTPLHQAATQGVVSMMRVLLQTASPADVNAADDRGRTALMVAAGSGRAPHAYVACKLLLAAGADVRARDAAGWTPLHRAAASANADAGRMVRIMLARATPPAAEPDARVPGTLATPLHLAASAGNAAAVRVLLDAGADIDATDARGLTAEQLVDPRRTAEGDAFDPARHGAAAAVLAEERRRRDAAAVGVGGAAGIGRAGMHDATAADGRHSGRQLE